MNGLGDQEEAWKKAEASWKKTRNYFLNALCAYFGVNPVLYDNAGTAEYKKLVDFCLTEFVQGVLDKPPESFSFRYLMNLPAARDALNEYNSLHQNPVKFNTLRHHAQTACRKIIGYLKSHPVVKKKFDKESKDAVTKEK